jgi:hypothetical protein
MSSFLLWMPKRQWSGAVEGQFYSAPSRDDVSDRKDHVSLVQIFVGLVDMAGSSRVFAHCLARAGEANCDSVSMVV